VGHITAAAGDSPGEEALGELLGEGLFAAAGASTLNALLGSQSEDGKFAEFLTYDDHLTTYGGKIIKPNTCSNYKTADSSTQICHAGLKARLSEDDLKQKQNSP
jgi:hypothetical protein